MKFFAVAFGKGEGHPVVWLEEIAHSETKFPANWTMWRWCWDADVRYCDTEIVGYHVLGTQRNKRVM